jgi:hypothetical protein
MTRQHKNLEAEAHVPAEELMTPILRKRPAVRAKSDTPTS